MQPTLYGLQAYVNLACSRGTRIAGRRIKRLHLICHHRNPAAMAQLGDPENSGSLALSPGETTKMDESMPSASGSNDDSDNFNIPHASVARPSRLSRKRPLPEVSDTSDDDGMPLASLENPVQSNAKQDGSARVKKSRRIFPSKNGVQIPSKGKQEATLEHTTAQKQEDVLGSGSDSDAPLSRLKRDPSENRVTEKRGRKKGDGGPASKVKTEKTAKAKAEPKNVRMSESPHRGAGQATPPQTSARGPPVGSSSQLETYRWWDHGESGASDHKWTTLVHHGVLFPPEHTVHGIPIKYDDEPVELTPKAEEVATFYAAKLETDYVTKETFNKNFFSDFRAVLAGSPAYNKIKKLELCDFSDIHAHLEKLKQEKKDVPIAVRKAMKQAEVERIKKYTIAMVDGREEKVGNFRVEPPGLFLGRGEHPLMGKVKARICPEDITINIGEDAQIPPVPIAGHKWGEIVHRHHVTWLCGWKDSITNGQKYVWLAAGSAFKGMSDHSKFEKARKLHHHIDTVRSDYRLGWKNKSKEIRQRSVAMYFIDKLALRVGNEKGEDEADTVGCCSLRVEHINFKDDNVLEFDFLGKDSIRYYNQVEVEKQVFENMRLFCRNKEPSELIFHRLTVASLNKYLHSIMDGLSAKVFRTYNASITLDRLLWETPARASLNDKIVFYNQQNKEVAILCNHQRALPAQHDAQMEKFGQKIEENEKWLRELRRGKRAVQENKKQQSVELTQYMPEKPVFTENMDDKQRAEERKRAAEAPRVATKRKKTLKQIESAMKAAKERLAKLKADRQVKEDLKTVALGTSKINYLDPRITVAWCKKHEVPIERIFAKTLLVKFAWAMETSEKFNFQPDPE